MKKLFDKIRKNNKGFTLVELIIVIAVMAILTVVVAPQYLKYIEKSRAATDENALSELKHIVEVSYVEAEADNAGDNVVVINIPANGVFTYDDASGALDGIVADIYPLGSYEFKSKEWKGKGTITFTVDEESGIATYTVGGAGGNGGGNGGGGNPTTSPSPSPTTRPGGGWPW